MDRLIVYCGRRRVSFYLAFIAAFALCGGSPARAILDTSTTSLVISSAGGPVTSIASGTVITLTAQVAAATTHSPVFPGQVRFCDATAAHCEDAALLATAQLTSASTATFKFIPSAGSHSYKAVFVGTHTYSGSQSTTETLAVTLKQTFATTTTITSSGSPGDYTLTATVGASGNQLPAPTGSVTFPDTTYANLSLGSASLGAPTPSQAFIGVQDIPLLAYPAAPGDFNGDGLLDLAIVTSGSLTILQNSGGTLAATNTYTVGTSPDAIVVADFNADGFPDLAVANQDGTVTVLLGSASGAFSYAPSVTVGSFSTDIAAVDLNGDGIVDLVTVNEGDNNISVVLGKGDGNFGSATSYDIGTYPFSIKVGDFNNDGFADLAVTSTSSNLTLLLGKGDGTFIAGPSPHLDGPAGTMVIGDFNGDGNADLAIGGGSYGVGNLLTVLLGRGDGTFLSTPVSYGNVPAIFSTADVNNDGITDLVLVLGNVTTLLGKGDGTFTAGPSYDPYIGSYSNTGIEAVGDFNGDGLPDLVITHESYNFVTGKTTPLESVLINELAETATATLTHVAVPAGGTQLVEASYPGDMNFLPSVSSTYPLLGVEPATFLTLTSNPDPSTYGGPVTMTATLSPYASAGNTTNGEQITFSANGALLGTGTLSSGNASLTIATLHVGPNLLTASYAGDFHYAASTSNSVADTVKPGSGPVPGYVVTTTSDDALGLPSHCTTAGSSNCSLRDALAASSSSGGGNITFAKAVFGGLNPAAGIQLAGSLNVPSNTSITAPLAGSTNTQQMVPIYGDGTHSVIQVSDGAVQVAISGLDINTGSGMNIYGSGGGIYNGGALTLSNVSVGGFRGFDGGGIYNDAAGVLTLSNSVVAGNSPSSGGAQGDGIFNLGSMKIISTIITENGGRDTAGGGIYNAAGATMSLTNTTVSDNFVFDGNQGGGILNEGTLTITSSSITGNTAPNPGGGSGISSGGTLTVTNSILADNITNNDDDGGPKFEDDCDGPGCPTNQVGGNVVGAGLSGTLPQSAAICAGLIAGIPAGLTTDQRGTARTTTYGLTTCVDAGALQQHYALSFITQPPASVGVASNFSAAVQLSESGNPFKVAGIAIPLSLGERSGASLSGGAASTDANGVASYNQLEVSSAGTGDTLVATLPVTTTPPPASQTKVLATTAVSSSFAVVAPQPPPSPAFSPSGGTYSSAQNVALSSVTAGASIYYTTNGAVPTTASTLYASPIYVAANETINAIAVLDGVPSSVSSATYVISALACQIIDYSKGFTAAGLSLNGGATIAGGHLQLTDGGVNEARSSFYNELVPVTGFTTDFTFQILFPLADGMTFTIQANSPQSVGQGGGGLGYEGIGKSVALKFDLFDNSGEGYNSVGWYSDGAFPGTPAEDLGPSGLSLHSWHVFAMHLVYANGIVTGTLTDTATSRSATQSVPADLPKIVGNEAYIGFTAGTGWLSSLAEILTWSFEGGAGCSVQ